jgi:RNA polymerase sigma factor (sigma-70 family)
MAANVPTRPSLLVRLREPGEQEAWREFVEIYTPLVFGFCRGRGLSEADAADVTQDVLRAVAAALPRFEYDPQRSTFRNWLFTVVRSKFNNHLAGAARRPRTAGDTTLARYRDLTAEGDGEAEEAWRREHRSGLVRWAAGRIRSEFNPATWDAFWRTAVLGEAAGGVARELGVSVNAVYIARSRVTRRLRATIDELGDRVESLEGAEHA